MPKSQQLVVKRNEEKLEYRKSANAGTVIQEKWVEGIENNGRLKRLFPWLDQEDEGYL